MDNKFWRNQNRSYVFDVDGTLSHARQTMDKEFHDWFVNWMSTRDVYLVTGTDRPKTVEQIGEEIVDGCNMSFQCAGNDVWRKGSPVAQTNFTPPPEMNSWLENELKNSKYPNRWGNHIEKRVGLINFCIAGRNMPEEERDKYFHWDKAMNERLDIAERFNKEFPGFQAQVGGNTSLDIFMAGRNKAQVYNTIGSPLIFFGDRCEETGNDYPLVQQLGMYDKHYHVTDPMDTWNILKEKYNG